MHIYHIGLDLFQQLQFIRRLCTSKFSSISLGSNLLQANPKNQNEPCIE